VVSSTDLKNLPVPDGAPTPDYVSSLLRITLRLRELEATSVQRSTSRSQILAVAMSLFTRKGYAGTSMREIASQVHIRAASLYSHYPGGKEQMLREGLHSILSEFLAFLITDIRSGMNAEEQLRSLVRRHIAWQLDFGDRALAWDAAINQFGVAGVLDEDAIGAVRREQRLYHDYLHDLVAAVTEREHAGDLTTAILALCDQAHRWLPQDGPTRAGNVTAKERDHVVEQLWRVISVLLKGTVT
jgi:AcrR family transcriptional regulator